MSKQEDFKKSDAYHSDNEIDETQEDYWLDDEDEFEEDSSPEASDGEPDRSEENDTEIIDQDESADPEEDEGVFEEYYDDVEDDTDETAFIEETPDTYDEFEDDPDDTYVEYDEAYAADKNIRPAKKKKKKKNSSGNKEPWESGADKGHGQHKKPKKKNRKKLFIGLGSAAAVLIVAYIGVSVFFMSHFYINTEINGQNFSGKTVADVEEYIEEQVANYTLIVQEKDNATDTISGSDISLEYTSTGDVEAALKKQNAFLWPMAFFVKNSTDITIDVSYDETALDTQINSLQAVQAEQTPTTNAYPVYDGNEFVIQAEVTGTEVDMDTLTEKVKEYITNFESELNMEEEGCYATPTYTSESEEVQAACDTMNQYIQASITYTMDTNVVVDKTVISGWLTVDENMNVVFDTEAVKAWLTAFGDTYDTVGTTRSITSPLGETVEVSGGTYGWSIDEDTEYEALITSIQNGEVVTKEPAYYTGGTAASHSEQDWGTTYAEVDISSQHMWYIVDGVVVLETDVVTGTPTAERETTQGVWSILDKKTDYTLTGETDETTGEPSYLTPVSYWMRITWTGIGFHDATWQSAFGGTRYTDGYGSHGCINMPLDMAAQLYSLIEVGTPVIVHS